MAARTSLTENEILIHHALKRCSKCRGIKNTAEFHKDCSEDSGYTSLCKTCNNKHVKAYYRKHRSAILKQSRQRWLAKYGLTETSYIAIQHQQNFRCKICLNHFSSSKEMHIDHCHKTGKVRGLLCQMCNQALGLIKDNINTLNAMIEYLRGS